MKDELIQIYRGYRGKELNMIFDELICFVKKYHNIFYRYTDKEYLKALEQFKAREFFLGTSYTNFKNGFAFEIGELERKLSNQDICQQVESVINDMSMYMLQEICPSCHYGNFRLASSIDRKKIIKACEECPYAELNGEFLNDTRNIIPANKNQVERYMNKLF